MTENHTNWLWLTNWCYTIHQKQVSYAYLHYMFHLKYWVPHHPLGVGICGAITCSQHHAWSCPLIFRLKSSYNATLGCKKNRAELEFSCNLGKNPRLFSIFRLKMVKFLTFNIQHLIINIKSYMLRPLRVHGHQQMFTTDIQIFSMVLKWPIFASPPGHDKLSVNWLHYIGVYHKYHFADPYLEYITAIYVISYNR